MTLSVFVHAMNNPNGFTEKREKGRAGFVRANTELMDDGDGDYCGNIETTVIHTCKQISNLKQDCVSFSHWRRSLYRRSVWKKKYTSSETVGLF